MKKKIYYMLMVFSLIFLSGTMTAHAEDANIPKDAVKMNGHYYKVYNTAKTWKQAQAFCEKQGGYLVTITKKDENEFVKKLIKSTGTQYHFWLGGTDSQKEGTWKWVTGEKWSYANWFPGDPNNSTSHDVINGQDYLAMKANTYDEGVFGTWGDQPNDGISSGELQQPPHYADTKYYGFVCEWGENLKAPSSATAVLNEKYNKVKVSWKKSAGASRYAVYYKKASEPDTKYKRAIMTSKLSYIKAQLAAGTNYEFKVVPCWKAKVNGVITYIESSQYIEKKVYTLKKLEKPTVTTSGTKVKVRWKNIPGETGYQISKSTKSNGTNIVYTYKTTTGITKTLSANVGKAYYYKVRAYKSVNGKKIYAPWSDTVKYTRTIKPVTKIGTYEADYGSTKYTIYVKKVSGNKVTFKLVFAGRYGYGATGNITGTAKNNKLSFTYKDISSGGKGSGTLTFKDGSIIMSTKNTSGNSQLATGKNAETLVWVSKATK